MAKATITLEDAEDSVLLSVEFDPDIDTTVDPASVSVDDFTNAQLAAMAAARFIYSLVTGENDASVLDS